MHLPNSELLSQSYLLTTEELPAAFSGHQLVIFIQLIRTVLLTMFICGVILTLVLVLIGECQDKKAGRNFSIAYVSVPAYWIGPWLSDFNETGTQPRLSHCSEFR